MCFGPESVSLPAETHLGQSTVDRPAAVQG
jgi:hypothetical protein